MPSPVARVAAAFGDEVVDDLPHPRGGVVEAAVRGQREAFDERRGDDPEHPVLDDVRDGAAGLLDGVGAEFGGEEALPHDRGGDGLHVLVDRADFAGPQGVRVRGRGADHDLDVAGEPRAVEGREDQPALAAVEGALGQHQPVADVGPELVEHPAFGELGGLADEDAVGQRGAGDEVRRTGS
jgi:hypothetical protein